MACNARARRRRRLGRRRRIRALSAAAPVICSAQLYAPRAMMPLDGGVGSVAAPELLVEPLLRLPGIAVQRPPMHRRLHHAAPLLAAGTNGGGGVAVAGRVEAEGEAPGGPGRQRVGASAALPHPPPPRALHAREHPGHGFTRTRAAPTPSTELCSFPDKELVC